MTGNLSEKQAVEFAKLALTGVRREFPNKPHNTLLSPADACPPGELHPTFFGCFDWHSAVHSHWLLVRVHRLFPNCTVADRIVACLDEQFAPEKLQVEVEYFSRPENAAFERTYGWAWLLCLAQEIRQWDHAQSPRCTEALRPLEELIVHRMVDFLMKSRHPIRVGTHADTAFAVGMMLDYARLLGNADFEKQLITFARESYLSDCDYPFSYEPSGADFFSSGLNEADLMRRILEPGEFANWLTRFFPGLSSRTPASVFDPIGKIDLSDGYMAHLAGLNLSRAWTMRGIAAALPAGDGRWGILTESAEIHASVGLKSVFSGHYEGEHWLATFAVYLLSEKGLEQHAVR